MDVASWFSVPSFVFLVVGVVAGAAAGHFFSPAIGESKRLRSDLERLRSEHDSYRSSVNSHFRKTADLVGQMTKSYAAVYDHLAGGARRFCDEAGTDSAIPFGPLPGALASPVIETAASAEDGAHDAAGRPADELVAPDTAGEGEASRDYAAAEDAAAEDAAGEIAERDRIEAYADAMPDQQPAPDEGERERNPARV